MSQKQIVSLGGYDFEASIEASEIEQLVKNLADRINMDYDDRNPIFIIVLSGAFIFAADLLREINIKSDITVVKVKSYHGFNSTGEVKILLAADIDLSKRHLVIIEDIVDTAQTLHHFSDYLRQFDPLSIETVCLLSKPDAHQVDIDLKYVGKDIPNDFVIGYGLDYNGQGRNLKHIFTKVD